MLKPRNCRLTLALTDSTCLMILNHLILQADNNVSITVKRNDSTQAMWTNFYLIVAISNA